MAVSACSWSQRQGRGPLLLWAPARGLAPYIPEPTEQPRDSSSFKTTFGLSLRTTLLCAHCPRAPALRDRRTPGPRSRLWEKCGSSVSQGDAVCRLHRRG